MGNQDQKEAVKQQALLAGRGVSLEEVVTKHPKLIVKLLKDQQDTIAKLTEKIKHLNASRNALATELRNAIKKDK